ncbi:HERC2 [Symbiodinium sp. CCMP2592]|nr:HERC2 [Symbiodinium sp. CCMP2592]
MCLVGGGTVACLVLAALALLAACDTVTMPAGNVVSGATLHAVTITTEVATSLPQFLRSSRCSENWNTRKCRQCAHELSHHRISARGALDRGEDLLEHAKLLGQTERLDALNEDLDKILVNGENATLLTNPGELVQGRLQKQKRKVHALLCQLEARLQVLRVHSQMVEANLKLQPSSVLTITDNSEMLTGNVLEDEVAQSHGSS